MREGELERRLRRFWGLRRWEGGDLLGRGGTGLAKPGRRAAGPLMACRGQTWGGAASRLAGGTFCPRLQRRRHLGDEVRIGNLDKEEGMLRHLIVLTALLILIGRASVSAATRPQTDSAAKAASSRVFANAPSISKLMVECQQTIITDDMREGATLEGTSVFWMAPELGLAMIRSCECADELPPHELSAFLRDVETMRQYVAVLVTSWALPAGEHDISDKDTRVFLDPNALAKFIAGK